MDHEERIRRVEEAVLHLATAVNRLIELHLFTQQLRPLRTPEQSAEYERLVEDARKSAELAKMASDALSRAVERVAGE